MIHVFITQLKFFGWLALLSLLYYILLYTMKVLLKTIRLKTQNPLWTEKNLKLKILQK